MTAPANVLRWGDIRMAFMKRIQVELLAMGFAFGAMALFAGHNPAPDRSDSKHISERQARAESAAYLDAQPTQAHLHRDSRRWQVTDGHTTAWLDARSGELLEVEFAGAR